MASPLSSAVLPMMLSYLFCAAALQYQINTRQFSKDQVEVITRGLMKAFCSKNMKVRKLDKECFAVIYSAVLPFSTVFYIRDECAVSRVSNSPHYGLPYNHL